MVGSLDKWVEQQYTESENYTSQLVESLFLKMP